MQVNQNDKNYLLNALAKSNGLKTIGGGFAD